MTEASIDKTSGLSPEMTTAMAPGWAPAIRQRRKALYQRLGLGSAAAMIFSPIFGWPVSLLWVGCYFAVQVLDVLIFAPVTSGREDRMGRIRSLAGCVVLFLNAASFGSMSVLLWVKGGMVGGVCAAILLSSGAIYAIVNSPRSPHVFAISLAPQLIYMAVMPIFMVANGAAPTYVAAVAIAILVFLGYCINTWQRIERVHASETLARLEADQKRAEVEQAMAGRAAFLAAVGHDLRTPISAILTGAAEMERTAADGSARATAALITDAGLMMKALLDDLLDHSRLDAGRMTVEAADFNLRTLLAQTLRLWQGPVRAKGLALRVEGASEMPAMVRGDAMRLRQVLNNLISNATKFTDTGSVTLSLRSWREEPSGHAILVEVRDTGPGMTADQLLRLFNPFDQTAEGVSARHGGSGLGLSISRDLAQLMGGRLTARAAPGEGSVFTLSLILPEALDARVPVPVFAESRGDVARALSTVPAKTPAMTPVKVANHPEPIHAAPMASEPLPVLAATSAPEIEQEAASEAGSDGDAGEDRPLRVLVVDDHDINRRAIELILAPLGCDVATAADGLAALAQCDTAAFDVIFMDVRMPELDGRETTRRIRAGNGPNVAVPVIAVTADTSPDDIAACMAAGMTYFVSKPLTPTSLLGALTQVLSGDEEAVETETVAA